MCSVYSAVSGEVLVVVDEYEGKAVKEIKQILAAQLGVPRFRQRFLSEDGGSRIEDHDVIAPEAVKIQLVLLEFSPPDALEEQKMIAAARDNNSNVLEELLRKPRSPNRKDAAGKTPLHHAARNGHVEPARLLLEAGATKDARDEGHGGWTPLFFAARNGHVAFVRLLIDAGADLNLANADGATPLFIAAQTGQVAVLRLLIEAGADSQQAKRTTGETPLYVATLNAQVEAVDVLLQARVAIDDALPATGVTPLCIACERGHVEVVRLLLGARVQADKATTATGATPLYIAAQNGHGDIVSMLIEAGADQNKPICEGYLNATPFDIAVLKRRKDVVEIFKRLHTEQEAVRILRTLTL
eukprot:Skav226757  [mRNA]  locus=scaffold2319:36102:37172:+ [translate_table: standard]